MNPLHSTQINDSGRNRATENHEVFFIKHRGLRKHARVCLQHLQTLLLKNIFNSNYFWNVSLFLSNCNSCNETTALQWRRISANASLLTGHLTVRSTACCEWQPIIIKALHYWPFAVGGFPHKKSVMRKVITCYGLVMKIVKNFLAHIRVIRAKLLLYNARQTSKGRYLIERKHFSGSFCQFCIVNWLTINIHSDTFCHSSTVFCWYSNMIIK